MLFQATAQRKTTNGRTETIVTTASWETTRIHAVEHFHYLYNDLCNQVGDRLDSFIQVGHGPVQEIPLLLMGPTLRDDYYSAFCKAGHPIQLLMDGGDNVTIRHYADK